MRTTVTLDPDVAARLKQRMKREDITFKQAINDGLRRGMDAEERVPQPYRVEARDLGESPEIDFDRALRLAGEIEDRARPWLERTLSATERVAFRGPCWSGSSN